jgi:hypothetical protein
MGYVLLELQGMMVMKKYEHLELLHQMVADGNVFVKRHHRFPFDLYDYTRKTQYGRIWNPATLDARGLILTWEGDVVARPFRKFFNFGEHDRNEIPFDSSYHVMEKVDGSLGIAYVGSDWNIYISTRGSFVSDQAIKATEMIQKFPELCREMVANKQKTYLFEIIYPSNRIVVDYGDFEGLVYLGYVDISTGVSHPPHKKIELECGNVKVRTAYVYDDINSIESLLSHNQDNFEGYVIRFDTGFMVKVKLDEYVRLHKIMTNISTTSVWEILCNNGDIETILQSVPDEFDCEVREFASEMYSKFHDVENQARTIAKFCVDTFSEKKDMAEWILRNAHQPLSRKVAFCMVDGKDYHSVIWRHIKPEHRRL